MSERESALLVPRTIHPKQAFEILTWSSFAGLGCYSCHSFSSIRDSAKTFGVQLSSVKIFLAQIQERYTRLSNDDSKRELIFCFRLFSLK